MKTLYFDFYLMVGIFGIAVVFLFVNQNLFTFEDAKESKAFFLFINNKTDANMDVINEIGEEADGDIRADVGYISPFLKHLKSNMAAIDFDRYGCWCNSAHKGRAVDMIDRCCQLHYNCYRNLINYHRCSTTAQEYSYSLCPEDIECQINNAECARGFCECDVNLSKCIVINISAYNKRHDNYNQSFC